MAERGGETIACDVAIVGAGPCGLAAAIALREAGVARVAVLEREGQAGGIPRHCGHPPYGIREFGRLMTGPAYARAVVARAVAAGVDIRTGATVIEIGPGPRLTIATEDGLSAMEARAVLLATGVRETSRAARLIGGTKPGGVMNTGALQGLVYLKRMRPFRRPLVVGTELVAFSALLTCRHAGIEPVAMVEDGERATARWPCAVFPHLLGVPLLLQTRLETIEGQTAVTGAIVNGPSGRRRIDCDGVILSGDFRPDAVLVRAAGLVLDPATGGPVVDQYGRTSDPAIFAAGNLLRPVETAGWCFREGRAVAAAIGRALAGQLQAPGAALNVRLGASGLRYMVPQRIVPGPREGEMIQLRAARDIAGELTLSSDGGPLTSFGVSVRPERRLLSPLHNISPDATGEAEWQLQPWGHA